MISVSRLKRLLAVLIALAALAGGMAVMRALAGAVLRSATGADPTSIFNDVTPVPAELLEAIEWLPDPERDGRPMEPTTRVLITDSYARALSALDRAGRGDPDAPLADYLSGPALDTALATASDPVISATFHLRQRLRLDEYSDDGSVVAIGVPEVEVVRGIDGATGRTINTTTESWRFTMLLEDGNWRIQQLQTTEVEPPELPGAPREVALAPAGVNLATVGGTDHTWTDVDDDAAEADLDAATDLGFETIRVFVAGPEADAIDVEALEAFLDEAATRGLGVIPVLFEDSPSHHPSSWQDDGEYLESVVEPLAEHEAIVAWDLKDRPDLDEELSGGAVNVDAWLTRIASTVRALDTDTPVTIGWSNHLDADRVLNWVDAMSFQFAGAPADLPGAIDAVVVAAEGRPVMLTGFASPEYRGRLQGLAPSLQATEFADLLATVDRPDLVIATVGLLRDPADAATTIGLLRHDGTERAIADVLRDGPAAIPPPTITERVRSQPLLVLGGLVVVLFIAGALRARLRRRRYLKWETEMIEWLDAGMPPTRRGRILRWRRVSVTPGRRRRRRLLSRVLWWRHKKPWEPPSGDPIDPIAYLAEQALAAADAAASNAEMDDSDDDPDMAAVQAQDSLAQPAYGPAFDTPLPTPPEPELVDTLDDGPVWGPPDDIADVDATAVAWVEGALAGMVRQAPDQRALAWVDDELGAAADEVSIPSADEPDDPDDPDDASDDPEHEVDAMDAAVVAPSGQRRWTGARPFRRRRS